MTSSEPPPSGKGAPPSRPSRIAPLAALVALWAVFFGAAGGYLQRCFDSWAPGGWDGIAHFAVADLYAREVFPAISGWLPEYFAGMPFPDFYPPLFYVLVAALTRLGLSTHAAFWTIQTLASALVPTLLFACARRLTGRTLPAFVAGLLGIGFLLDGHTVSSFGVSLRATFEVGLATQLLAFDFTLAFLYFFLRAHRRRRDAALAAVCLAAVPLTNVHVVWNAAILFLSVSLVRLVLTDPRQRLRELGRYLAVGSCALLLSAVWVLPMLARLQWVPTFAMEPPDPMLILHAFLRLGFYVLLATGLAAWHRDAAMLGLGVGLFLQLGMASLPMAAWFPDVALQPGRFLIAFRFLGVLAVAYLVAQAARGPIRRAEPILALTLLGLFALYLDPVHQPAGIIGPDQGREYAKVLEALDGRTDGRILVEMGDAGLSDAFALQSLVGRAGGRSLTTVFRESASSSLFTVPLRNSFSTQTERFGVDSKMPPPGDLVRQSVSIQRARLTAFNVRYFVVHSLRARHRLGRLPGVRRLAKIGRWHLFEWTDPPGRDVEIPAYEPVLTFARFSVKKRPDDGLDFIRLEEERFATGRLDVPLALERGTLDAGLDPRFRCAMLVDYPYDDEEAAFEAVERFSREHPVILASSTDPLFQRLRNLATRRPTLHVVSLEQEDGKRRRGRDAWLRGRRNVERLLDALERVRVPTVDGPRILEARLDRNVVRIRLDRASERPVPILVRRSYFPDWRVVGSGAPLRLASPTFQMAFAHDDVLEIRRRSPPSARWGALSCVLGALGLFVFLRARHP